MDSFIFLPVENGKLKDSSFTTDRVKKGEEEESVSFEQLLSPFLFSWRSYAGKKLQFFLSGK